MPVLLLVIVYTMVQFINPGYAGHLFFMFAGCLVFPFWIWLARVKFKQPWKLMPLAIGLPIAISAFVINFVNFIDEVYRPYKEEKYSELRTLSDFRILSGYLLKYKEKCGALPSQLEDLLEEKKPCWNETDFTMINYRDKDALKDEWGRFYQYRVSEDGHFELGALGMDGVKGGERIDKDQSFRL